MSLSSGNSSGEMPSPCGGIIVEHFMLFNFTDAMEAEPDFITGEKTLEALNNLSSIPGVRYLFAGPNIRNFVVSQKQKRFAYCVHARFFSSEDLRDFLIHPAYTRIAVEGMCPAKIKSKISFEFKMHYPDQLPRNPRPGEIVRLVLCATRSDIDVDYPRFRERSEDKKKKDAEEVLEVVKSIEVTGGGTPQINSGICLGVSDQVGQGYSVGLVACFDSVETLDRSTFEDLVTKANSGERVLVWDVIVVDYVVPQIQSSLSLSSLLPAVLFVASGALVALSVFHRRV